MPVTAAGGGAGSGTPPDCAWFMVPPGLLAQLGYEILHPGSPDVATPHRACGAEAAKLRAQGYQSYDSKTAAQNASAAINTKASPVLNSPAGIDAIGGFFTKLGEPSTWIRVAEVVLGVILLAVGVARITHAVPIATKIAKTAGAAALA
jgi:hypothetical protein